MFTTLLGDSRVLACVSWIFAAHILSACAHPQLPSPATPVVVPAGFALHEVAANAWVLQEVEPWAANVLLAEMPDGTLLLVNAPATEGSTRALLDYIRARFGERRLIVINSHHHVDSVGGNALLLEHGAEVIASTQTAALTSTETPQQVASLAQSGLVSAQYLAAFSQTRIAGPSRTFDSAVGLVLHFGDEDVRVLHPGAAHSIDNVVVHFPRRRLLFGGCMVRSGNSLGPTEHADLAQWPHAIDRLIALAPEVVVPGHGARFDADQLHNTRALLDAATTSQTEVVHPEGASTPP